METPTPISSRDRMSMNAPLRTPTAMALPNLRPFVHAPQARSSSANDDLGDIVHEEAQPVPTVPTFQTAPAPSQSLGKRRVPRASKDEWADSSDDELSIRVIGAESTASEYFQSAKAHNTNGNPPKKAKTTVVKRDPRFHRMSGPKQESPKPLSMSKNAVDFRGRRDVEKSYKEKVRAFIDKDILRRVDSEGGITPTGRFYKAVYMMMERKLAQPKQLVTSSADNPGSSGEIARLKAENQKLRQVIEDASEALGHT
ncbi:hypothetical protein PV04_02288 [Phialophora macrospora]|uniref:Uncharacterized protein n=1 Tax=Phialophora macrospora TaxID=1851006 RepID=A0A0D2CXU5_9EURO|nr:hypothetical protein PV04_02288 [Phialophora macrospora]